MSASGAAPRATLDLRIRVWGMGANNQPFHQNAVAQNVSVTGACICGLEQELKVGDVIGVQYETKKARCKVIWVIGCRRHKESSGGSSVGGRSGVPVAVQAARRSAVQPAGRLLLTIAEDFSVIKFRFPLEFRDERVNTPMRVNATDISGNGCYVETAMPLPVTTVAAGGFLDRSGAHHGLRHRPHPRSRGRHGHRIHRSAGGFQETLSGPSGQARPWPFQAGARTPQKAKLASSLRLAQNSFARAQLRPVESASSIVSCHRITEP